MDVITIIVVILLPVLFLGFILWMANHSKKKEWEKSHIRKDDSELAG